MKSTTRSLLESIAHLLAMAMFGTLVITVATSLFSVGVSLVIILGIGLIFLALLMFMIAAIARLEENRVAGLFGFNVPAHSRVVSTRTEWWRWFHTSWLQAKDPRNWKGALHFVLITALGWVALASFGAIMNATVVLVGGIRFPDRKFWQNAWFDGVSGGGAVISACFAIAISLVLLVVLAFSHRSISRFMMVPDREEELADQVVVASSRRRDAINAAEIERSRIERDLHDGVQPRLVSVGMTLGMAKNKLESDPEAAAALIEEAHTSTKAAITELRQLARGIHPAVLDDRGLDAALSALVARSQIPVQLDVRLTKRYPKEIETALYFTIAETLTNAAKHSRASEVRVTVLERQGGRIWARIEDDGTGGAVRTPGGGIDGIAGRITAIGGTFSLTSPVGGPTTVEVSAPCES